MATLGCAVALRLTVHRVRVRASSVRARSADCSALASPLAGEHVSVLAGGDNLAAIRDTGLTLVEPDGSTCVAPGVERPTISPTSAPHDVVVLALKAHQIAEVADRLPSLYHDDTVVVPLQNGVPWWFFQKFPGPYEGRRLCRRSTRTARSSATSRPTGSSVASPTRPRNERDPESSASSRATGSRSASSTGREPSASPRSRSAGPRPGSRRE